MVLILPFPLHHVSHYLSNQFIVSEEVTISPHDHALHPHHHDHVHHPFHLSSPKSWQPWIHYKSPTQTFASYSTQVHKVKNCLSIQIAFIFHWTFSQGKMVVCTEETNIITQEEGTWVGEEQTNKFFHGLINSSMDEHKFFQRLL